MVFRFQESCRQWAGLVARASRLTFQFLAALLLASTISISAQQVAQGLSLNDHDRSDAINRTWQFGGFVMGGFPPYYEVHTNPYHYREEAQFYSAAFEAGRMITALHGNGFLRGRGEAVVEVIPFWIERRPAQEVTLYSSSNPPFPGGLSAFITHGVSVTPLLFRWNFMKRESVWSVPFFQLGSGLLWTSQSFPQSTAETGGNTSRINFTPQVDFGESIFTRKRQSLNVGGEGDPYVERGTG